MSKNRDLNYLNVQKIYLNIHNTIPFCTFLIYLIVYLPIKIYYLLYLM